MTQTDTTSNRNDAYRLAIRARGLSFAWMTKRQQAALADAEALRLLRLESGADASRDPIDEYQAEVHGQLVTVRRFAKGQCGGAPRIRADYRIECNAAREAAKAEYRREFATAN